MCLPARGGSALLLRNASLMPSTNACTTSPQISPISSNKKESSASVIFQQWPIFLRASVNSTSRCHGSVYTGVVLLCQIVGLRISDPVCVCVCEHLCLCVSGCEPARTVCDIVMVQQDVHMIFFFSCFTHDRSCVVDAAFKDQRRIKWRSCASSCLYWLELQLCH